jgi:transcriptional regulator with XRE-family HTH domain
MECGELLKLLGERIRTLRKGQEISQERLAELAGLHPVFISKIETGKVKASICSYNSIANALNMSLSELVELPGEKESWDSNMVALFQSAKRLSKDKQTVFVETVKGMLSGLEGV